MGIFIEYFKNSNVYFLIWNGENISTNLLIIYIFSPSAGTRCVYIYLTDSNTSLYDLLICKCTYYKLFAIHHYNIHI